MFGVTDRYTRRRTIQCRWVWAPRYVLAHIGLRYLQSLWVILGLGVCCHCRALGPADAVRASEEAMRLIRALTREGRAPVTFDGRFDQVAQVRAPPVATPPIWTGAT